MRIDQTRFKAFWASPERYRLAYQCEIVPSQAAYGLARGIAFHTVLDCLAKGLEPDEIKAILLGERPDLTGRTLRIAGNAIANGWELAKAYVDVAPEYELVGSEQEFDFPIPGSPHSGVGRLDRLIRDPRSGELWLLEFKTANARARHAQKVDDWKSDVQADFEILGARSLDFYPVGVRVQYVQETTPPNIWQEIEVRRSEAALQRTRLAIHQTCETIEMYLATFGLEQPWPHLSNWPCVGERERCEYSDICQSEGRLIPEELGEHFTRREEHLDILRDTANVSS